MKTSASKLVRNPKLSQQGISLIEVLIAVGIMSIVGLGMASLLNQINVTQSGLNLHSTIVILRDNAAVVLKDDISWKQTYNSSANTASLDCLKTFKDCNGVSQPLQLVDSSGNVQISPAASSGFTLAGTPCDGYSDAGNTSCPLHIDLTWSPICPTSGACYKPDLIRITGTFKYRPSAGFAVPFNPEKVRFEVVRRSNLSVFVIANDVFDFNLANALNNPTLSDNFEVWILPGIKVGASATSNAAFTSGGLPPGSTLKILNRGTIQGAGGRGGRGGDSRTAGASGLPGGPALNLTVVTTIDNGAGKILGGGGGGGGGAGASSGCIAYGSGGGGGGGAGAFIGAAGTAGTAFIPGPCGSFAQWKQDGTSGAAGTALAGGAAGIGGAGTNSSNGGKGGAPGKPGQNAPDSGGTTPFSGGPGGAAGAAIVKNGNTLTWISGGSSPSVEGAIQ